jgi:outer membrane protein assembly factor BamB
MAGNMNPGPTAVVMFRGGDLQVGHLQGFTAFDPQTGAERRKIVNDVPKVSSFQCNASRATESYLLTYSTLFTDNQGKAVRRMISRSTCGTGVFPANGMVYTTINYCGCHTMLRGNLALGDEAPGAPIADGQRLERGIGKGFAKPSAWPAANEWPTFMGSTLRLSSNASTVPKEAKPLWQTRVAEVSKLPESSLVSDWYTNDQHPGPALPPIVAGGKAFVAVPERHVMQALDAATGAPAWSFTAGGRVGTPTIYGGLCLFGSHDGWVYALNASDGALAWRFLAAPNHKQMMAYSQLESCWPVASGVAILDGGAFVVAGRHPHADGGMHVYRLDPATGRMQWKSTYTGEADAMGKGGNAVIHDLLVSDGTVLYLKSLPIDPMTGTFGKRSGGMGKPSTISFGDKTIPAGRYPSSRWGLVTSYGMAYASNLSARYWAVGDAKAYSFKAGVWNNPLQTRFLAGWPVDVLTRHVDSKKDKPEWKNDEGRDDNRGKAQVSCLILAGGTLVVAGRDGAGGFVDTFSATDGAKISAQQLATPVIEKGVAVADGRIYVSTADGLVTCFGAK